MLLATVCCLWLTAAGAEVRVDITGVDGEIEANIRATLDLVRHGGREDLSEAAVRRLHSRAPRQIREAMRPYGYYRPRVQPSLEQRNGEWRARFVIDAGEPVLLKEVDVRILGDGSGDGALLDIVAQSPLREGRRLNHQEYDRLRNRLQATAAMRGYFDARFEQRRLEVDPSEHTARAVLHMSTGPRYRFGSISVEQDIISAALLDRIVLLREGEPYDANALLRAQYRLSDTSYFAGVVVESGAPDEATLSVPIRIETTATRGQRIRLGLGYATDTRLRGSIGVDWRHLNKAGHSAGTELRLSEVLTEISGRYRIPIGDPLQERLLFRGGLTREDLADIESQRISVGVSHVTMRGGGWQRNLFADLLEERTRTPNEPEFRDLLIVPGIGMEKLIADDVLFPRNGYRVRGEVRGSHHYLGARTDFLRIMAEANRVSSAGESWRFFLRSAAGYGIVGNVDALPASQRFFAGGDQSVRGYGFNSLGPRDADGNVIGGRHLLFGAVEAERLVWGRYALAAFLDAGNAFNDFDEGLEASVGVGVNVHTPIGTLRVAMARSITESRGMRFHLSIMPDL
ncbi:MAG TPA: autotransporter assembly complex family protein [Gammaproteobacteria bacterium]|nr:autotransporter assembly complex family protein [Gammaproteobacteria bacterium]